MLYNVEDNELPSNITLSTRFYSPLFNERGQEKVKVYPNELLFMYAAPGSTSSAVLCLRQISSNIPRCEFAALTSNQTPTFQPRIVSVKTEQEEVEDEVDSEEDDSGYPVCSECKQKQNHSMVDHFVGNNKPENESLKCVMCNYIAATQCSLSSHVRIHQKLAPHICPECGKDFPNSHQLNEHLDLVCFHLAKQVRFRCPGKKCGKLFAQIATFMAHFMTHLPCFNKCASCAGVYFTDDEFAQHANVHSNKQSAPLKVYKCSVCPEDNRILSQNELKQHVELHVSHKSHRVYAYVCRKCRTYIRSPLAYANHLLRCAKVNQNDEPDDRIRARYSTNICFSCNTKFRYRIYTGHARLVVCPNCRDIVGLTESERINKCVLCNIAVEPTEKETHKLQCKYGRPVVVINREDLSNPRILTDYLNSSPKSEDSARKRRRRPPTLPNKTKKPLLEESDLYLQVGEPVEFDGVYRCKLCAYENNEREQFHSHIISHRDVSTAYQCMECGECFVVKPSLIKHLHYFHKISNTEEYFEENDCFDKGAVKELEENMKLAPGETKGPVEENQCRVCLMKFENDLELNKHFRVHGMAFLLRNSK